MVLKHHKERSQGHLFRAFSPGSPPLFFFFLLPWSLFADVPMCQPFPLPWTSSSLGGIFLLPDDSVR